MFSIKLLFIIPIMIHFRLYLLGSMLSVRQLMWPGGGNSIALHEERQNNVNNICGRLQKNSRAYPY